MKKDFNWNTKISSKYLIDISNYYMQINHFLDYFEKDDFLILDFDDLKYDYDKLFKNIYKHIGIENFNIQNDKIKSNITKANNRNELRLKKKLEGRFTFLPKPIKKIGRNIIRVIFKKQKKKLTKSQRNVVYEYLKSDMDKFKSEFKFPTDKWGF